MVRVSPHKLPPLSLERTSQRSVGQVSWLAAFSYSLHLPKAWRLSGSCRFRSAYSCGAAMASHHLPWSQSQIVTNPTSSIFDSISELTTGLPALSKTFWLCWFMYLSGTSDRSTSFFLQVTAMHV